MPDLTDAETIERLAVSAHHLTGADTDYAPLIEEIGDRPLVLLGEASHGTHEFYRARAEITKLLIAERGFNTVAVEADFPDAARVNRFVRGIGDDADADRALADFERFPLWMWRNHDVLDFVSWLRAHNDGRESRNKKAGFYGIDLYSLNSSIAAVLDYLDRVDPAAAARARSRYECFEHFEDSQAYGYAASAGHTEACEQEAVEQLVELQRRAMELAARDGREAAEDFFTAEQNARLVANAEEYYRSMFRPRVSSWNLRDRHMIETVEALVQYGEWLGVESKIVVWAHNSHIGDARATEMGERGEWNVGQLARERFGDKAFLVGFSTYTGTVTAATNWGDEPQYKRVREGMTGSYEELFHHVSRRTAPNFLLTWREGNEVARSLAAPRLERAIGVIYRSEIERHSHYFDARLSRQFDALLHFDTTRAVRPLEPPTRWTEAAERHAGELPETYPSGL